MTHLERVMKLKLKVRGKRLMMFLAIFGLVFGSLVVAAPAQAVAPCTATAPDSSFSCTYPGYGAYTDTWADTRYLAPNHNCTRYAAFRLAQRGVPDQGTWGNAEYWNTNVANAGYPVNTTAAVGAIAQWEDSSLHPGGHVAHVDAIGSGWIEISDDSWGGVTRKGIVITTSGDWPDNFLHIADVAGGVSTTFTPGIVRVNSTQLAWHLNDENVGQAATITPFTYGVAATDTPITGDWDGNGSWTPGIVRVVNGQLQWHLRNDNSQGSAEPSFTFGTSTDMPVVGDWDGNGTTTIGIVRHNGSAWQWHLRNSNSQGSAYTSFNYGLDATDIPIVGDWDSNGTMTVGVVRPSGSSWQWHLRNSNSGGSGLTPFLYGLSATDTPIVGDWNGNGSWTPGVVRVTSGDLAWHLRNNADGGSAHYIFTYGVAGDIPLVGNWNG